MTAAARPHFCPRCGTRRDGAGGCDRDGTPLAEIVESSLLGQPVGNYIITQRLGEGGMGAVYRAVQPSIGAEVAIKVLHATPESQRSAVDRFLLEARAVNSVAHPNLIKILDTGELPDRRPFLVMELLDGVPLSETVGALAWPTACLIAADALDALDAVHAQGFVHRDLKPANIFLARGGRVVVLDFGIAKLITPDAPSVTASGIIGTPEYMAPEQIRSAPIDRRADVYAMGVLLYEAITGRRPFTAAATFDMLVQHVERPPPSPREWSPELPLLVAEIVLQALAKDPAHRFSTAAAMAAALRSQIPAGRASLAHLVDTTAPAFVPVASESAPPRREPTGTPTVAERPRSGQRAPSPDLVPTAPRPRRTALVVRAVVSALAAVGMIALVVDAARTARRHRPAARRRGIRDGARGRHRGARRRHAHHAHYALAVDRRVRVQRHARRLPDRARRAGREGGRAHHRASLAGEEARATAARDHAAPSPPAANDNEPRDPPAVEKPPTVKPDRKGNPFQSDSPW